jgi:hypothetical protein
MKTDTKRFSRYLNMPIVDGDKVIKKAVDALNSKQYSTVASGLIAVTGRRPVELITNGYFYLPNDYERAIEKAESLYKDRRHPSVSSFKDIESQTIKWHKRDSILGSQDFLLFVGQAKQRENERGVLQPFPIPVLGIKNNELLDIILEFRKKYGKKTAPCCKTLNASIYKVFKDVFLNKDGLYINDSINSSDLRSIYSLLCWEYYYDGTNKLTGYSQHLYYGAILGSLFSVSIPPFRLKTSKTSTAVRG